MGSFCSTDDSSPDKQNQGGNRRPNAKPYNSVDQSVSEESRSANYEPSVTINSQIINSAASLDPNSAGMFDNGLNSTQTRGLQQHNKSQTQKPGNDNQSLKIMVTPPDDAANEGLAEDSEAEYNKIKDDLRKRRDEAENLVEWRKVADFASILPKEAKEKLWKGVFKTSEDEQMPESKKISKVLRTFVMLHLTRQYKRDKKEVPDDIRSKLPAITKNPSRFIAEFIKKSPQTHSQMFESIFIELKASLESDRKVKAEKLDKKVKQLQANFDELNRKPISSSFNQTDFLKQAYLQYILYAYQRRMDELN